MKAEGCSNNLHNYNATQYSIQLFQWRAKHHWQHDWTVTRTQYIGRSVAVCTAAERTRRSQANFDVALHNAFVSVCCLSSLQCAINSLVSTTAHSTAAVSAPRYSMKMTAGSTASVQTNHKILIRNCHKNYHMNTNINT